MATGETRAVVGRRTNVATRVAAKFRDALRGEALEAGTLALSARIAGTAAAAVAELPAEARRKLTGREPELISASATWSKHLAAILPRIRVRLT